MASVVLEFDLTHLVFCNLGPPAVKVLTALGVTVCHIVSMRASKEMIRVHARTVVARVADHRFSRLVTMDHLKHEPMGRVGLPMFVRKTSVTVPCDMTGETPTFT